MTYLDYIFSLNPYSPEMSKVEEDFAYFGSIEIDGSLWDQIGKIEQLVWLGKHMLSELEARAAATSNPKIYITGPIYQLTCSIKLLLERGALITAQYIAEKHSGNLT